MRPDAFAAVMATGIVSIAAADHELDVISAVLAAVAAVALPVLVVATARAWRRDSWSLRDLDVSVGLLTYVAACCVLAARFAEHRVVLWVLGGLALQGWLSLAPMRLPWDAEAGVDRPASSGTRCVGVGERGDLRIGHRLRRSANPVLGVDLLGAGAGRVLRDDGAHPVAGRVRRVDPPGRAARPLDRDGRPRRSPRWRAITSTMRGIPGRSQMPCGLLTIVTWALASLWILPLTVIGWRRVRNWPAVFPLGMYSSATFAMALETGWSALRVVSLAFFWIASADWLLTLLAISARLRTPRDG